MLDAVKNFAKVIVSTGYDASATSIVLETDEGAKLPDPSTDGEFNLVWWNFTDYKDPADDPNREIVRCTARSTDTLTVTRNQEGSGASTKNTADKVYKMVLALTNETIEKIRKSVVSNIYESKKFNVNNPYADGGATQLKGQMHCHSDNSDGVDTPTEVVTAYKTAGYDFVTITDHDVITADPEVADIIWLCDSIEETVRRHINVYDVSTQSTSQNPQEVIDFHKALGRMCSINHPNWDAVYIMDDIELAALDGYNFIEVFNKIVNGYGDDQWDFALSRGKKVFAFASDDCHDVEGADFDKGWVVVNVASSSASNILASLRKGNFYASTGNDITISVSDKNVITASSAGSSNFTFIGRNGRVLKTENGVTSSEYTIVGDEMYVRVKSEKVADGTFAWSQPVFIDILGVDTKNIAKDTNVMISREKCAQALVNGNFDIWQRGATVTDPASGANTYADKWDTTFDVDGGTNPTLVFSRQLAGGYDPFTHFCLRLAPNGAGSGFGDNMKYGIYQAIDFGTTNLCGLGKKVTVSFWARSSLAGKRIGITMSQRYGTGGSPSANEQLIGDDPIKTLTEYWQKYTVTFETNTLYGKTFGTNYNNKLLLLMYFAWGTTKATEYFGGGTAEDFGGSGTIDIAQVQVCEGDVAIPFKPKSVDEELFECQKYCIAINTAGTLTGIGVGNAISTTIAHILLHLPREMSGAPSLSAITVATDWQLYDGATAASDVTALSLLANSSGNKTAVLVAEVASGLTQWRPYRLQGDGTANRLLILQTQQ